MDDYPPKPRTYSEAMQQCFVAGVYIFAWMASIPLVFAFERWWTIAIFIATSLNFLRILWLASRKDLAGSTKWLRSIHWF